MLKRAVLNREFDGSKGGQFTIVMNCDGWNEACAALAGLGSVPCQRLADAIFAGLVRVGYYLAVEEKPDDPPVGVWPPGIME